VDSLKALDPERPIREADIGRGQPIRGSIIPMTTSGRSIKTDRPVHKWENLDLLVDELLDVFCF
jgi:hypothetical protein